MLSACILFAIMKSAVDYAAAHFTYLINPVFTKLIIAIMAPFMLIFFAWQWVRRNVLAWVALYLIERKIKKVIGKKAWEDAKRESKNKS